MPSIRTSFIPLILIFLFPILSFSQLSITSVNPLIVERFDTVTITGTGFLNVTEVVFGNQKAKSFEANSDSELKAVINHGAAGTVKIVTASGQAESSEKLLVAYDGDLLFVGSYNEDSLNVVHPEDGKVIGKIRLPRSVEYFCIHPDNRVAYASDPVKDSLYEISLTEWKVTRQIKVDDITAIEYNPVHRTLMVARVSTTDEVNIKINGLNLETLEFATEIVYLSAANHPNFGNPVTNDKLYFNTADNVLWFARNVSTGSYTFNSSLNATQTQLTIRHFHTTENPKQVYGFAMLQNNLFTLSYVINSWVGRDYKRLLLMYSSGSFSPLYDFFNAGSVNVFASSQTLNTLYCADASNNRVNIIDPFGNNKLKKTLNVGQLPTAIGISPKSNVGYTLNRTGSSITVLNLTNEIVSKNFSPGFSPKNYEGSFVANYDAFYKSPEILSLSTMVAQPGDTVTVFGKRLNYIENIKIENTKVDWFKIENDSTISMIVPESSTGLMTFITKITDIPFETFRICYPGGFLQHNGFSNQLICKEDPFSFVITKNPTGDPSKIKWLVNSQFKGSGAYYSSYFSQNDTIKAIVTIDSGNCAGYNLSSQESIINLTEDTLTFVSIPYDNSKNQSVDINTSNLTLIKNFDYPNHLDTYDTLNFTAVIDIKNNYLYCIGPKAKEKKSLYKYNFQSRKLELFSNIYQDNSLHHDEIVLGNDGKFLYYCIGNQVLVYQTDSLKLFKSIDLGSGYFENLKNDGNKIRVSKLLYSGDLKLQHIFIDTATMQITSDYVFNGVNFFMGYDDQSKFRYNHSDTKIFETNLDDSNLNQEFTLPISYLNYTKNIDRVVVFSDQYENTSNNSGLYSFTTGDLKTFPYLIKDAIHVSPGKLAIITESNYSNYQFKTIDANTLKTLDSITLPNFYGWYGKFGSPFMQSYTISHPPCTNKIRLCNGLPNAGMVLEIMEGSSYQWQISTDNGITFENMSNTINYSGTQNRSLNLINMADTTYGFFYRCLVDGNAGEAYKLVFENTWKPMHEGDWEDPLSWSCGVVPGPETEVIIFSGSVKVNNDISVKSLQIMPGVEFTVEPGKIINITQ